MEVRPPVVWSPIFNARPHNVRDEPPRLRYHAASGSIRWLAGLSPEHHVNAMQDLFEVLRCKPHDALREECAIESDDL
jgi:hypothetical protein